MDKKRAVNQRIKELMIALGEPKVDPFYKKYWGKDAASERLRSIVANEQGVKTDFLVELISKVTEKDGKKVNGHWLLTGQGEMFLQEKGTAATNPDEAAIRQELQAMRDEISFLKNLTTTQAKTIFNLSGGEVIEQG